MRRIAILFAIGIWAVCLMPALVSACPVCIGLPDKSSADYLIESQCVVLAREHREKPFAYMAASVLKGDAPQETFDLFMPSATRRHLQTCPDHAVVLVREGPAGPWQSLGIADPEYQALIKRILAFSSEWQGDRGARRRCEFFVGLLAHENREIFELAYLELGRAPYAIIRQVAPLVPADRLRTIMDRREYYEWRPLAILLLAQNPTPENHQLIENSFRSCVEYSISTNLGAWATAWIEIRGPAAIAEIEQLYFRDASRTDEEIRAVVLALEAHGEDPGKVKNQ